MFEVTELYYKAIQGRTEPYLCSLSDGNRYYIKGQQAGTRGLINEAICAYLGKALNLPVPDYCYAYLPGALLRYDTAASNILGQGDSFVFASRQIPDLLEVNFTTAQSMPVLLKRDLFLFDYWIKNEDRTMTEHSGNPNLFYRADSNEYVVLDHNLAFDHNYNFTANASLHPGYTAWFNIQHDNLWRNHYNVKLAIALQGLAQYAATLPPSWLEDAPGYLTEITNILASFNNDEFWEVLI
ncbi:hypothetical protein QE250_14510 [Chromatiaceae bacterium AAb-1]|nr:hypothetical protein [Chromatiaceae bacterium AAb-1]